MRSGARAAIVGAVFAAMVGVAGCGSGQDDSSSAKDGASAGSGDDKPSLKNVKTGPPSAAEVKTTARAFLAAWSAGETAKAAALTDDTGAATTALGDYRKKAHVAKVALEPGSASGAKVPFSVNAQISSGGRSVPWTYESSMTVTRDTKTGKPVVAWKPSVVQPDLAEGDTLRTGASEAPPIKAVDRDGKELTAAEHPTLKTILAALRERYGKKAGGKAGVETYIERAKGSKSPDKTLKVLSKGTPGTLRTTIDASLQSTAEQQVSKRTKASVVAVKPSTGEILAVANSPASGFNTALQGSYAPGSTMKIITSATLIDKGLAAYGKAHPCPKYFSYGGWKFQNDKKFEIKNGTFEQSFARSCNTAFISQAGKLKNDDLTNEARNVFGIGLNWQTGVPSFDGAVPVQSAASKAASLIGQGGVRMNPLNMASVAATASTGTFRQPYLVAPSLDDRTLAKASKTMKSSTHDQLRKLMRLTATSGTAAEAMAGMSGDFGAKTGSAEVDNQEKPNGWFSAYRDDIAAAGVVPEGGHGGDTAGPMVAALLRAGG
ncbi:penicillin-binding transpeptidase domain-containing protein [Streptomyces melanosporofaciens]|uniref:NTF2-like N-terminal transpeptidase domain-containing protein n=1 Tax=Streptomyces melanosporofaciens TaxID=67327 RepID=A0A1H4SUW1_STRMJ|nr:penicillin-binding transpeptidase domain-containing protein [Streptomyces melanosporofaciens]SEC47962.1 NTF2-like N-terminal transpeptidase domain-containing protein [Streptomyces melanosporofaciens]